MRTLRISKTYTIATIIFFILEVLIALYVNDSFVRPFIGDTLAVILVYCFLKILISDKKILVATISLGIAFCIETLQALDFITFIGLDQNILARIVLGTSFSWGDIIAYIAGAGLILIFDRKTRNGLPEYTR